MEIRIATVRDLMKVNVADNGEAMVNLVQLNRSNLILKYEKQDMLPYCGEQMWVREEVANRLAQVVDNLAERDLGLQVTYAYRHPEIQELYFNRRRAEIARDNALDDNALTEHTHMFCAYPPVAGHPTGGAVDVKLLDKAGQPLDFGTEISDFTKADLIPTFCEGLTRTQRENRGLLLDIMCQAGFAPFLGEWWHFSYGDREWSWWNRQKTALYQPLDFRPLQP